MSNARIVLIIGSGASTKAGMPTLADLTKSILDPGPFYYENNHFVFGSNPQTTLQIPNDELNRFYCDIASSTINAVYKLLKEYSQKKQTSLPNYEDIYYCLEESHRGSPYGIFVREKLFEELEKMPRPNGVTWAAGLTYGIIFIKDFVQTSLLKGSTAIDYLSPLTSLASNYPLLQICSLNHDTIFEASLKKAGISFESGFHTSEPFGWSEWNREKFENHHGIRIIKPHGSVDWFFLDRYFEDETETEVRLLNRPINGDVVFNPRLERYPVLIIGTENKLRDYTLSMPFNSMQFVLYRALMEADVIICAGYGFGDFGVNQLLNSRLIVDRVCNFILIDPCPKNVLDKSSNQINWFGVDGHIISKRIEDVTSKELNDAIIGASRKISDIVEPFSYFSPFRYIGA